MCLDSIFMHLLIRRLKRIRFSSFNICVLCWQVKGFELSYLEKVAEVKDTVHRQSLLYHTCKLVVDKYPESSDVYSEIAAISRSAKVRLIRLTSGLAGSGSCS